MMYPFDISVVIINYNSAEHTIKCVKSIVEKTDAALKLQIIVVDNQSKIEDYQYMCRVFEEANLYGVEVYRNQVNSGFGGGNMFGFQYVKSPFTAFINNDTWFLNDCLSLVRNEMFQNDAISVGGAQAFKENGDFMISLDYFASPAREILGRGILELLSLKKYPKRKKKYTTPLAVPFVPGSFMMVRTEEFALLGGFDPYIFLYYEETDLCLRYLKQLDKKAYLIPSAEFVHIHGASTAKSLAIKKEQKLSLFYILRKHYGVLGYQSVRLFFLIKYFFTGIIKSKNRSIFTFIWRGAPMSESLRLQQKIEINAKRHTKM